MRLLVVSSRVFAVTLAAVTAAAVASPAAAAPKPRPRADVTVSISAPRNVLPLDGWTSASAIVRNQGTAPASGVQLAFTLAQPFQILQLSTSSEWSCSFTGSTGVICDHVGDLAAGATAYQVNLSASLYQATVGQSITGRATVTTSSRESNTTNNSASQLFHVVDNGVIQGVFWHDLDADGIRETGEPIIDPFFLSIWSVDDEDLYGFSSSFGPYSLQVPAKNYYAEVRVPKSSWRLTTPNVGSDDTDSDVTFYRETTFDQYGRFGSFLVSPSTPTVIDIGLVPAP